MADILIKGLEMPNEMECVEILLFSNGHCSFRKHERDEWVEAWAVALPEHGRLCDLDALIEHETYNIEQALFDTDEVLEDLKNAPVIVEASND